MRTRGWLAVALLVAGCSGAGPSSVPMVTAPTTTAGAARATSPPSQTATSVAPVPAVGAAIVRDCFGEPVQPVEPVEPVPFARAAAGPSPAQDLCD